MPAPIADWSQVKATAIGTGSLKDAAQHHQVSYKAVKMRASREKWPVGQRVHKMAREAQDLANHAIVQCSQGRVTSVTSAAEALESTLKQRQNHTKLGLSLFAARAARVASKLPQDKLLARAGEVKAVADIASKVWPEVQGDTGMHVSFFSITTEHAEQGPIIDVTPE